MAMIPNLLTISRIVLIPFFVWQLAIGNLGAAAILLIISGVTDLLDGFLARRFGWVSRLGMILDPLADKLTQLAVCVMFIIKFRRYWGFFALIIATQVVMLVCAGLLIKRGMTFQGARWSGKLATTAFYLVVILMLLFSLPVWAELTLLSLLLACILGSGLLYLVDLRHERPEIRVA